MEAQRETPVAPEPWRRLVRYATLAPSPYNTQPWLFCLENERLHVQLDPARLLTAADPVSRQAHVAIGAAIENLAIAATSLGKSASVELMPQDSPESVAVITLEEDDGPADPLIEALARRRTNPRVYLEAPLPGPDLDALTAAATDRGCTLELVTQQQTIEHLAEMIAEAAKVALEREGSARELYQWMRFSEEEARRAGDGLPIAALQLPALQRFAARRLLRWETVRLLKGAGLTRSLTRPLYYRVTHSPAVGLITLGDDSSSAWLQGGRALERVWLTATIRQLWMQPASAPLESKQLRERLREAFQLPEDRGLLVLFRIGSAPPPTFSSPRRAPDDVLRNF